MNVSKKTEREFTGVEYVFTIFGSEQRMVGTIKFYNDDDSAYPYHWEVKSDCFSPEFAPISKMIPSSRSGRSVKEAYDSMTSYLESMSLHPETEVQ